MASCPLRVFTMGHSQIGGLAAVKIITKETLTTADLTIMKSEQLRLAELAELKEIIQIFQARKSIFPHVRQDYIKRKILANQCVYQDGVVITFNPYKVKVTLGSVNIRKGSYIIHQIVNAEQGNGSGSRVLDQLCRLIGAQNEDVYLTVRADNKLARTFYEHKGFKKAGDITWSRGTIPGIVYRKTLSVKRQFHA